MKTLGKKVTAFVFGSEEGYKQLKQHWSTLMQSERKHELGPEHHVLYLALLGKDFTKGFTPVTNPKKLDNGMRQHPLLSLDKSLYTLQTRHAIKELIAPFGGIVSVEMVQRLQPLVKGFSCKGDNYIDAAVEAGKAMNQEAGVAA